jgi:hypothetical protein
MTNACRRTLSLALAALCPLALGSAAPGDDRPRASSTVKVKVQGAGGGVEPVAGAPPAVEPSLTSKPARAAVAPAGPRPLAATPAPLRAVTLSDGEATLEIEGRQEVVRPGSVLRGDTVRSVTPEHIVLERPAPAGDAGGPGLVIMTFDEKGQSSTRVIWTRDPARDAEVKQK